MDTLGDVIKKARVAKGISQQGLADSIKIKKSQMSYIENAVRMPSKDVLKKLADELDLDIGALGILYDKSRIMNDLKATTVNNIETATILYFLERAQRDFWYASFSAVTFLIGGYRSIKKALLRGLDIHLILADPGSMENLYERIQPFRLRSARDEDDLVLKIHQQQLKALTTFSFLHEIWREQAVRGDLEVFLTTAYPPERFLLVDDEIYFKRSGSFVDGKVEKWWDAASIINRDEKGEIKKAKERFKLLRDDAKSYDINNPFSYLNIEYQLMEKEKIVTEFEKIQSAKSRLG